MSHKRIASRVAVSRRHVEKKIIFKRNLSPLLSSPRSRRESIPKCVLRDLNDNALSIVRESR